MNWYMEALKKYAVFSGRSRRKEYWYFLLFNLIIGFAMGFVDGLAGWFDPEIGIGPLGGIYNLAVLLPSIAVVVRRLHDIGKSGWWLLLILIPIVGALVLVVFACFDSESGSNRFGPNPKSSE